MQERRDVVSLKPPVSQIAVRRAGSHALLVYLKEELIVRTHMHEKALRLLSKLNHFAKVQYRLVTLWGIRGGDPFGAPHLSHKFRRVLRRRNSWMGKSDQGN